ncbi:papain-like cysteine protease family protein [Pyxidicoccus caerfyrddinensis]|uniref:papain-like cysteine protease family protein n=1 Tax=Pyxidicoccus caerfyrddinensis TaxID=2709663 RepID=UPI0013DAB7BA|nr:papain-like cysteine protease family protein [Pyxidicoccus caerfyrddinensis]
MGVHRAGTQPSATQNAASSKGGAKGRDWLNIPHINQLRPDGANEGYVNGASFCGPAVVAMLARGANRYPGLSDARLIQELSEGLVSRNGTSPQDLTKMLERVNLPLGGPALSGSYSDTQLQQHLRQGHKLIAQVESVNAKTGERSAHYIVVRGMTPDGKYRISNPMANGPQVLSPNRLRGLVNRAPPDGGMLIPVAQPRNIPKGTGAVTPKPARLDTPGRNDGPMGIMARREARNDFKLGIDYGGREVRPVVSSVSPIGFGSHGNFSMDLASIGRDAMRYGSSRPVTPDRFSAEDFAGRLLWLKRKGEPKALHVLELLQSSPYPRDQRVFARVMRAELRQPGIGKKILGDPC